jgi:hypothetical protein
VARRGDRGPVRRSRAVERRASAPLSPLELRQRAQARRRLGLVAVLGVGLGVATLIAAIVAGRSTSSPRPTAVPAGYQAVDDGVFAYAVPRAWTTNQAATDNSGDRMTGGPDGWVAEHVETRVTRPGADEAPPTPFKSFGESRPTPFSIGPAAPTRVTGTTSAFRYAVTRPGGFRATAIEAWSSPARVELWMFVHASPATTATILSTLTLG